MEDITGRYLKQIRSSNWQTKDYIGSYFRVVGAGHNIAMRLECLANQGEGTFSRKRIIDGEFEVMPAGFIPEEEKTKQLPIFN